MRKGQKGNGFPVKPIKYRVFSEEHPELIQEWDVCNQYPPSLYSCGSGKKVWWKCKICGFRWFSVIRTRHQGCGCPKCAKGRHLSKLELRVYAEFKERFKSTEYCNKINGIEIDVYIPEINLGIEIDGNRWHKDIEKDKNKNEKLSKLGIEIIRLREGLPKISERDISYPIRERQEVVIQNLLRELKISEVPVGGKLYSELLVEFNRVLLEKSIYITHPNLSKQWSEKNYPLEPRHFSKGSIKSVFWKCDHGHEWEARIDARVRGNGCPYCSGKTNEKVSDTSFAFEWSNKNLIESKNVPASSRKKFFWYCKKHDFHYLTTPNSKKFSHTSCPICSGRIPIKEESAASCNKIMDRWVWELNKNIDPNILKRGSAIKVWIRMDNGELKLMEIRSIINRNLPF